MLCVTLSIGTSAKLKWQISPNVLLRQPAVVFIQFMSNFLGIGLF